MVATDEHPLLPGTDQMLRGWRATIGAVVGQMRVDPIARMVVAGVHLHIPIARLPRGRAGGHPIFSQRVRPRRWRSASMRGGGQERKPGEGRGQEQWQGEQAEAKGYKRPSAFHVSSKQ